jgi:ferredoxin
MANKDAKNPNNTDGKFYVDDQCIGCNACVVEAPDFFKMDDDEGVSFVYKQPSNDDETTTCENALAICPVEAIGNDGE